MAAFSNLRLGARLGWGFCIVIVIALGMALLARQLLSQTSDEVTRLTREEMVRVHDLSQVKDNLNVIARGIRNVVLLTDEKEMRSEQRRIEDMRARNTALLARLDEALRDEAARALLANLQRQRSGYNALVDKVSALGLANQSEAAVKVLLVELRPVQADLFKTLDALIDQQEGSMRDSAQAIEQATHRGSGVMLALAVGAALLGGGVAWVVTRSIVLPVRQADGIARRIARGDLTEHFEAQGRDEVASMLRSLHGMQQALRELVASVHAGVDQVSAASVQIAQANQDLSSRTEAQASALEEAAASMEQLGSTVRHNADNARAADRFATDASGAAGAGGQVVGQVVDTMRELSESSQRIADIIGTIDGIAFQTNILALNAAVEAARAGEQGRGFAVVAGEVRGLAGRCAQAAKEIRSLIGGSVTQVREGATLAEQAGSSIRELVAASRKVSELVTQIAAASQQQSQGVAQVGEAVAQLDQTTQQNAALVEQTAAAAASLRTQASELVRAVARFKLHAAPGTA